MTIGRIPSVEGGIQPTIVDAKGDLIVATAADTVSRLAVGSANQVLTVDSSTSTGLKWAAAGGTSSFVGVSVKDSGDQTIANNTEVVLTFNQEDFDTDGFHSTTTNTSRLTVPSGKAGKYLIQAQFAFDINGTGDRRMGFYKNGSVIKYAGSVPANATLYFTNKLSYIVDLAVNDYIEVFVFQNSGGNLTVFKAGAPGTNIFQMTYLGA